MTLDLLTNTPTILIYLNNYDEDANTILKTNVIKVYGATSEPNFTYKDRGVNQVESSVSGVWDDGVYTLTLKHNGSVDITINCFGNETYIQHHLAIMIF